MSQNKDSFWAALVAELTGTQLVAKCIIAVGIGLFFVAALSYYAENTWTLNF